MPRHKEVPTLQQLSLSGIGSLAIAVSKIRVDQDPHKDESCRSVCTDWLNRQLASRVPHLFHDSIVDEILKAYDSLSGPRQGYEFVAENKLAENLIKVVVNLKIKQIYFPKWPRVKPHFLSEILGKMCGLEKLDLTGKGGWDAAMSIYKENIIEGISHLRNLRFFSCRFHCDDIILQAIGKNCPHVQGVDVIYSTSVTDRSIPFLLKCSKLVELQLHETSVTMLGLAELLAGLPNLQDIGFCSKFGQIIQHMFISSCLFGLRRVECMDLSREQLQLMVGMFPKIEHLSLFHDRERSDLRMLNSLVNLNNLELIWLDSYRFDNGNNLKPIIEVRGNNITHLHLGDDQKMCFNVLVDIGEFCKRLERLVLYKCAFVDSPNVSSNRVAKLSFLNLENIVWDVIGAADHLEFILTRARNIKRIHLGSTTGITNQKIVNILAANPMKYLVEFRVSKNETDMNMRTVELLLASCPNLKILSELESWKEVSEDDLKTFQCYIRNNNFELDLRHVQLYDGLISVTVD